MMFTRSMLLALAIVFVLPACGDRSDTDFLAEARSLVARNDPEAAISQLKALLQQNPQQGEARFLLGRLLLDAGDAPGAEIELRRALYGGHDRDEALPLLARALLTSGKPTQLLREFAGVELKAALATAELKGLIAEALISERRFDEADQALQFALLRVPDHPATRVLVARLKWVRGDSTAALAALEELLKRTPLSAEAWVLKGDLLAAGDGANPSLALDTYRKALAIRSNLLPPQLAMLSLLIGQGDIAAAREQWATLKRAFPEHPETAYYEAVLALDKGDAARAREISQELLSSAPEDARLLALAGRAALQLKLIAQAEALLGRSVLLAPAVAENRLWLAEVLVLSGQADKALVTLKPLLDSATPEAAVLALAGRAQLQLSDLKAAEANLQRAARLRPADVQVRVALALTHLRQGRGESGVAELEAAARADPGSAADLALIEVRLDRREFDAAALAVDRLAAKRPGDALAELLRGRVALRRGDAARARSQFDAALLKSPDLFDAITELTRLDLAEAQPASARARLQALLQRQPGHAEARLALAEVLARGGGRPGEVVSLLEEAIKLQPRDAAPRAALIDHHLARANAAAALSAAQRAVAELPGEPSLVERLGRVQAGNGDLNQALASYSRLVTLLPNSAAAHLLLAETQLSAKQLPAAAANVRRALELDPRSLPAQRAAISQALQAQQFTRALAIVRMVQGQQPEQALGFLMEAELELAQNRLEPAITLMRTALGKGNASAAAVRLHATLLRAGQSAEAQALAERWRQQQPDDVDFMFHLSELAMSQQRPDTAEAQLQALLQRQPEHAQALDLLARSLLLQQKPGASALAERAVRLLPGRAPLLDTLARSHAAEQRLDKALDAARQAVALAPAMPEFRLSLARLQIQAGNKEAARTELYELAKLGYDFPGQGEVAYLQEQLGANRGGSVPPLAGRSAPGLAGVSMLAGDLALTLLAVITLGASLVLLIAAARPPNFSVQRWQRIAAPPQHIFDLLQNLRQWEEWSSWGPFARTVVRRFSRSSAGLGAGCYWQDKARGAEGSMEVMHLTHPVQLAIAVTATLPVEEHQLAEFLLEPDASGGTMVSWVLRGEAPFLMRVKGVLRGHGSRQGRQLQADLKRLQALAERVEPSASANDAVLAPA